MSEPISLRTLLLFLTGHRDAINRLASSRNTLWVGAAFVLSASLARNYDGAFLLQQPHVLLHGFAASVGNAALLFCLFFGVALFKQDDNTTPPFWSTGLKFLALFWWTSPLAWLYAIPFERFLEPSQSISANYCLVGLVSLWRVLLITRVLTVLFGGSSFPVGTLVLFYSTALVVAAGFVRPAPLIDLMGGVHRSDTEMTIGAWYFGVMQFGMLLGFLLFFASLYALTAWKPVWSVPAFIRERFVGPPVRLALMAILIWIPALLLAQPEQHRRWHVERLLTTGQIAEGIAELSSQGRDAYPRIWSPPPHLFYRENVPPLLDVISYIHTNPDLVADWVKASYAEKAKGHLAWNIRAIEFENDLLLDENLEESELCDFIAQHDPSLQPELRSRFQWAAECFKTPTADRRTFDDYQKRPELP